MYIVHSYSIAIVLCVITMLCWGSWANTQKLATKKWAFQLFYWDYTIGLILLSLVFGLTLGSTGNTGQAFISNLSQVSANAAFKAVLGGVIFNIANLLLVAAIEIAGMAIAFPIGIGIALVLGVIINYIGAPQGDPVLLFGGVALIVAAIFMDAMAYKKISAGRTTSKGIVISLIAGVLMASFYRFVAASMSPDLSNIEPGSLTPYSAVFIFSIGVFLSNFLFNSFFMYKPISGNKVSYSDYFKNGDTRLHLIGIFGGVIWSVGMLLNMIASGKAGFAISYGLGQGATMVAAFWGVFIWKEFKNADAFTKRLINFMFLFFMAGIILVVLAGKK